MDSKQDFKMIPDTDEIEQIDRELRFQDCGVERPTALTGSQIADFNAQGFLIGLPVFSPAEMAGHRSYFDRLLQQVMAEGGDSYSISTAHLRYGAVYNLLCEPRIVAYVRDLLGNDVIGWGSHYFCKMPGDGKTVAWHQDASYWPLSPSRTVTVWLAIDDADRENACMQFLAGSHREGRLKYRSSEAGEGNVLNQTVENVERFGDPVDVILPAGQISIHSDLLLHGSGANQSDRRRCGLTLRYCTADVRAGLDWNHKGVCVAGSDPSGHWANPPRPASD